ncbi:type II secretion system protein GspM [Noviherbaspirillum sp. Root189]|uniref:type II secretion system protein GspM n=1 Tax=Noviherbaspirillum sp. Root189 TaxID=1736487 RepID=UPI00070E29C7|nr:type II secretion system protein GspM [Noviherbaspirillum sp. Root189]KRB87883.1 general secretion pathway protein GspM [Noviherbaspirillum sp. Root189]
MNATTTSRARTSGLKQSFTDFWSARNKREQNMLTAAAVVIVLGLLYLLLVDPALSGRSTLEKTLPALRQQAAEVQALSREAAAAGGATNANTPPPPPMTRESLEASLTAKGLKPQNLTVTGELAKLQLNGVSFAGTVDWLAEMQRNARIAVVDAVIEPQGQQDTVNATLTLRQQKPE